MNDTSRHSPSPYSLINSLFRSQTIRRILLLLAIFHFFLLMCYSLPKRFLRTDRNRDVLAYYLVSERIQKGEQVYWPLPEVGPHKPSTPFYLYPPVLSSILAIMPPTSFVKFAQVWTVLLYAVFYRIGRGPGLPSLHRPPLYSSGGYFAAGQWLFSFPLWVVLRCCLLQPAGLPICR